jgi:hypothetical protein
VGGVAEESDTRDSVPPVPNGQSVDCAKDGGGFSVGDQCGQFRGPPSNSAATCAVAVAGLAKSMPAIHACGLESAT